MRNMRLNLRVSPSQLKTKTSYIRQEYSMWIYC